MANTGKLASFTFAGVSYTTTDCLQSWDLASAVNDIVYECAGFDSHSPGTKSITFTASLALSASDTTKVIALEPGTTGAFEAHPGGDTAGNIEITATRAQVNNASITAPINGIIAMDVTFALDDITYTTAA